MKKILLLLLTVLCVLFATPYDDLSPNIYELRIIESDNWMMEINLFSEEYFQVDTFMIKNKSDSAMVLNYTVYDSVLWQDGKILVINPSNLSKPLTFDKSNDIITLSYIMDGYKSTRTLKLGDYPGSVLDNIDSNQSICYNTYFGEHRKSNTPTIESANIVEPAIIYGKIYDGNGVAFTNVGARFYNGHIIHDCFEALDENGYFEAKLGSRRHYFESIIIMSQDMSTRMWNLNPVELDLEPGDSLEVNFYSSETGIIPIIQSSIMLNSYPQPATDYSWFVIGNTDISVAAMRMNIYDLNSSQ